MTRCFVVGNGPSLARTNLDLIKDEISYGMQRIHLIYPKTTWRPTYWVCADKDKGVDDRWLEDAMFHLKQGYPCYFRKNFINDVPHLPNATFEIGCEHWDAGPDDPRTPTEWHFPKICRYGGSMSAALQFAVREKYNPIYVIGADCGLTLDPTKNHFDPEYGRPIYADEEILRDNLCYPRMHAIARKEAEARGITIYNATLGGEIEAYERVDYNGLFGV